MKTFKDNADRTWTVQVNVDAIKRVRDLAGLDLLSAVDAALLEKLASDPVLLCDVVYAVCKGEADAKGVTDEDFGRSMAGDAIDAATAALLEELVDFFPRGRRQVLAKAMGKLRDLETKALALAAEKLDSPELDRRMREILEEAGEPSGSLPGSSASTPDH